MIRAKYLSVFHSAIHRVLSWLGKATHLAPILGVCALTCFTLPAASVDREKPAPRGVFLGFGYDSTRDKVLSITCIEFSKTSTKYEDTDSSLEQIVDIESGLRMFDFSSSFAMNAGVYGGDASLNYLNRLSTTSSRTVLFERVDVRHGPEIAVPKEPEVEILLSDKFQKMRVEDPDKFRRVCGDSFVYMITSGGAVDLVYEFTTATRDEREELSSSGKAKVGMFSASLKFTAIVTKYKENNALTITMKRRGGLGNPLPVDLDGAKIMMTKFSAEIEANPKPLAITLRSYSDLSEIDELPESNSPDDLASLFLRMRALQVTTEDVVANKKDYHLVDDVTEESLNKLRTDIQADMIILGAAAKNCLSTGECSLPSGMTLDREYEYRSHLPARRGASKEDQEVIRIKQGISSLETHYYKWKNIAENTCSGQHECKEAAKNFNQIGDRLKLYRQDLIDFEASKDWNRGLLDERISAWLEEPRGVRCRLSYTNCIPPERIVALRKNLYQLNSLTPERLFNRPFTP